MTASPLVAHFPAQKTLIIASWGGGAREAEVGLAASRYRPVNMVYVPTVSPNGTQPQGFFLVFFSNEIYTN